MSKILYVSLQKILIQLTRVLLGRDHRKKSDYGEFYYMVFLETKRQREQY